MATRTLNNIEWCTTEPIVGENDPEGRTDTFNRPLKQLWALFAGNSDAEHNGSDGSHRSALLSYYAAIEEDTFAGNSTDDRDVALTDTALDIEMLWVWSEDYAYLFFASESMTGDETKDAKDAAFVANHIQSVGTGTFQLGNHNNINDTGTTYYYLAVGHH